jgi:hypothetical protein
MRLAQAGVEIGVEDKKDAQEGLSLLGRINCY